MAVDAAEGAYVAQASADAMPIGLTLDDVTGLATFRRNVFVFGATPPDGLPANARRCDDELFGQGMWRVLNSYVAGMHVDYGLAALSEPRHFLLTARRLADELYGDAPLIVDASPGNARSRSAIEALYPDAALVADGPRVDTPVTPSSPEADRGAEPAVPVDRPIFIVGCPRSGTTWLQHMFGAHPDVGGPAEESVLFTSLKDLRSNAALNTSIGRDAMRSVLRRFTDALLAASLQTTPGATRALEKTPHHALHLDVIADLYPEAFVIAIERDGRAVVRSLLEVPFGTDDAATAAAGWVQSIQAVEPYRGSAQVRVVRYEALRADPVMAVSELLAWTGLDVNDAVRQELADRAATRVSAHNEPASGHWTAADERAMYRVAGDQLVRSGYLTADELAAIRRSVGFQAGAALDTARRQLGRSAGKLKRLVAHR